MRLLHTSDWHLGHTLHQFERSYEHQRFLDWLLETLEDQQADTLIIAGDIFDNPNPSADAQRQFYQFLSSAKQRCPQINVVMIAGNHDSVGRLEAPHSLLQNMGMSVVGSARNSANTLDAQRLLIPLHERDGTLAAWCLAVPFLRPGDLPTAGAAADDVADNYALGVRRLYQHTVEQALQMRETGQALIALGHCHLRGGQLSQDSERRIVLGGAEALPADIFDPAISYVALGHLHRAQRVASKEWIRYCGSPLPLSFSEINYQHQVLCVELHHGLLQQVTPLLVPRCVELLRIPAQPAPLPEVLEQLDALQLDAVGLAEQPYLQVRVQVSAPDPSLRTKVEAVLAQKPVRLVRIETSSTAAGAANAAPLLELGSLAQLQASDIFERLYRSRYHTAPSAALLAAFHELEHELESAV